MENKKNIPGMRTCSVCGRDFPLLIENRYTARDNTKVGLVLLAGGSEESLFDAIDCPHCGCQNILQARKRHDAAPKLADMTENEEEEENE